MVEDILAVLLNGKNNWHIWQWCCFFLAVIGFAIWKEYKSTTDQASYNDVAKKALNDAINVKKNLEELNKNFKDISRKIDLLQLQLQELIRYEATCGENLEQLLNERNS